jgi:phosphoribosylaminoimidazole-succinocarboxamide synthase
LENRKEDKLIEGIVRLIKKEMRTDMTLPLNEAFKRIIDKNPQISKRLEAIEIELIKKNIMQGRACSTYSFGGS